MALEDTIEAVKNSQPIAENAAEAFTLLGRALVGVTEAYTNFGKGAVLFTDQYDRSVGALKDTNAYKMAANQADFLAKGLGKLGLSIPVDIIRLGAGAVEDYAKNLFKGADNAIRLQGEFLKMSAATGNLSNVFQQAGGNLENLNAMVQKQAFMMTESSKATGVSTKEIQEYYLELGRVPGALDSVVQANARSGGSLTMMTAAIKLAHGSGRDMKEIMQDLTKAFEDYGLKGEAALKFSARFGEVANNLGLPLDNVRKELLALSDSFSKYVNDGDKAAAMSENLAKMTNEYVTALKAAGSTGMNALRITQEMIGSINNLGIAQKAFLSGQSGGPGGLMGAYQIEKMLREGNTEGVMKMMTQQMQKQFGKIVTLDEAASSPGAAAQLTRQIQIMKQGPLGSVIKSDQDAIRMLEAMKMQKEGKVTTPGLSDDILAKTIDQGTKIEEKSYTVMAAMAADIEGIAKDMDFVILNILQKNITASGGVPGAEDADRLAKLQDKMRAGAKSGANLAKEQTGKEVVYQHATDTINSFIDDMSKVPEVLKNVVHYAQNLAGASSDDKRKYFSSMGGLRSEIESKKNEKLEGQAKIDYEMEVKAYNEGKKLWEQQGDKKIGSLKDLDKTKLNPTVAKNIGETSDGEGTTSKEVKAANRGSGQQTVKVVVEGYCIKCKNEIDRSGAKATSVASNQ